MANTTVYMVRRNGLHVQGDAVCSSPYKKNKQADVQDNLLKLSPPVPSYTPLPYFLKPHEEAQLNISYPYLMLKEKMQDENCS